jgi:dTDP-4-dehydrorhamnose reductase
MRILITGAGGQLGTALCETRPDGVEVAALSRDELDITDPDAVALMLSELEPETVINTAAYNAVDGAEVDEGAAYGTNFHAVAALAARCRTQGARLLHLSTDYVFDGRSHRPYATDDRTEPLSIYGKSKLAGEQAALEALGPAALIVRTAWLYSDRGRNFVHGMLERMRAGESLRVVEDQVGTPTWVVPLARALWSAHALGLAGLHHWTPAGSASRYDLASAIQEEAAHCGLLQRPVDLAPIQSSELNLAAERPAYSVLDKRETWAALGETPPHWRVHLRTMLAGMNTVKLSGS